MLNGRDMGNEGRIRVDKRLSARISVISSWSFRDRPETGVWELEYVAVICMS